ncbi:MAG: hypothetical protein WA958_22005 [Tunicatimonas sp.]
MNKINKATSSVATLETAVGWYRKFVLQIIVLAGLFTLVYPAFSQTARVETNVYYGIQKNFFVDYDRTVSRSGGYIQPIEEGGHEFYQKNSIGTIYGVNVFFSLSEQDKLGIDFSRTENAGRYNFTHLSSTQYEVSIDDVRLRHTNNAVSVIYRRQNVMKNLDLGVGAGVMFSSMQELSVYGNRVALATRNWEDFIIPLTLNYRIIENSRLTFGAEARTTFVPVYPSIENIAFAPYFNVRLF